MELAGKVKQILEPVEGENQRGKWRRQDFVIETEGEYPSEVCFTVWNEKFDLSQLKEGMPVTVYFNLSSREHNGRWYTSATAWRIQSESAGEGEVIDREPPEAGSQEINDDLPF